MCECCRVWEGGCAATKDGKMVWIIQVFLKVVVHTKMKKLDFFDFHCMGEKKSTKTFLRIPFVFHKKFYRFTTRRR